MGTAQNPLTLLARVKSDKVTLLAAHLEQLRAELEQGNPQPFERLQTIHYARMFLLRPEDIDYAYQQDPGVRLVFATDFDGPISDHLAALADHCGDFIDGLYSYCEQYPEPAARTAENRLQFLRDCQTPVSAFFAGAPGRSLSQIHQENSLRDHIWKFLHENKWKGQTASQVFQAVKKHVRGNPDFEWTAKKAFSPRINLAGLAMLGIAMAVYSPVILIWVMILRIFHESRDKPLGLLPSDIDGAHLRELETYEDLHNQNQFTQVLVMKPGPARLITLQSMMLFARFLIRYMFVHGKLMGIPTIHFARWVMIDSKKVMLFFSNFDGSWQQYLGDFIDKSGWGLTGIWSNTVKFPKTRFLLWGGAYDEEHFLAWSRYYQIPTQVWYCAYPQLSIKNIINNSYIRRQLGKELNDRQSQEFLNRF
jgi:hypothetical protein